MVTYECINSYYTCRGVITGLYPHSTNVVSEFDHVPVVVSCTTGQYHDIACNPTCIKYSDLIG